VNLLKNYSFENNGNNWLSPWDFKTQSGVRGSISHVSNTKVDGIYSVDIAIMKSSSNDWYAQLLQGGISVVNGQTYTISFWAKASKNRTVRVVLQQNYSPYNIYIQKIFTLTPSWQKYIVSFTQPHTDSNILLDFNVANATGNVWIDKVSIQ